MGAKKFSKILPEFWLVFLSHMVLNMILISGSGFVTNKVNLATSGLDHIPPAFKIPNDTQKLKTYASDNPEKMFVQKNSNHRGIKIEKLEDLDLEKKGSFIQEFIHDPFLVDGYKFDIGKSIF